MASNAIPGGEVALFSGSGIHFCPNICILRDIYIYIDIIIYKYIYIYSIYIYIEYMISENTYMIIYA